MKTNVQKFVEWLQVAQNGFYNTVEHHYYVKVEVEFAGDRLLFNLRYYKIEDNSKGPQATICIYKNDKGQTDYHIIGYGRESDFLKELLDEEDQFFDNMTGINEICKCDFDTLMKEAKGGLSC